MRGMSGRMQVKRIQYFVIYVSTNGNGYTFPGSNECIESNHVLLLSEDATISDIEAFRISGVSLTTPGSTRKQLHLPKRLIDFL